ncbi:alpha/beta hydrolase [Candidatus Omnitrophota bacterium]
MTKVNIHEHQYLIRLKAEDKFPISTLLVTRESHKEERTLNTPVLLQIHGLLGHFLARGTPRLLPHALLEHGYSSMSINTRLAFAGQINGKGVFNDTIKDIDAAVDFLEEQKFKNIYILGYSLGASMLVNWAANRKHKNIKGIILEGAHYSIPDWWKRGLTKWGSSPAYEDIYKKAKDILGKDPYGSANDETFVVYQSRGPSEEPSNSEIFTYKTWWFMAGPEAHNAMAHKHIGKVKFPILMIRGEGDPLVEDWEPPALARIVREAGNKHVKVVPISKARHDCMENADEMVKEIINMMSEQGTNI